MRPHSLLPALLFMLFFAGVYAQDTKADSLIRLLNKAPEDSNKVNRYFEVGVAYVYQSPPMALTYFRSGLELAKKIQFNRGMERNYTGISLSYSFMGGYDSAKNFIDTAIYYARIVNDPARLALVYLNRADISTNLQNLSEAVKNCDTAITFAEKINNKSGLARIYSVMSDVYVAQKQYDKGLESLDKSQRYFEEIKNMQMVGMCHFGRADILMETGKLDQALPFLNLAVKIADSVQDYQNLSSYYGLFAQLHERLKRSSEAEKMAKLSLKYAVATGNRKQEALVHDLFFNIYNNQKQHRRAIAEELKAYEIMKEEKDLSREYSIATNLAEAYFELGDTKEAYKYLKISRDLNDSMIRQQFNAETAKLQTTFEVTRKDKEIQLLNKEKELQKQKFQQQRLLMIGVSAIALLAFAGIWLLMNRNKLKQRMKELELRNQIAADLHDEVGSSLSSIHMLSQMATAQTSSMGGSQQNILQKVSSNARETMDRMSDIVWMIKPGETEAGSLKERMERFAAEISSSRQIGLQMDLDGIDTIKVSMAQRKNIYLIFKEALNNAAKYSGADKLEIRAHTHNRQLTLLVKDNGKGFDLAGAGRGNGLDNMRNRATESNGTLHIRSAPGQGTELELVINT